jgi:hypothetical protein
MWCPQSGEGAVLEADCHPCEQFGLGGAQLTRRDHRCQTAMQQNAKSIKLVAYAGSSGLCVALRKTLL